MERSRIVAKKIIFCLVLLSLVLNSSAQGSGNAVNFNGSSYIDLGANHRFLSYPLTFTYWVKRTNLTNFERVFSSNNGGTGYSGFHSQILPNGTLESFYGDGNGFAAANRRSTYSNIAIALSDWVHCAFVIQSSTTTLIYVNGVLVGTNASGSGGNLYQNPTGNGAFGRLLTNVGWENMIGELDDFTIWNKALNATEIRDLVCRKTPSSKPQLLGYYDFDLQIANQIFDASPNAYTGTFNGTVTTPTSGASIGDTSYYTYAASSSGSVSSFSATVLGGIGIQVGNITSSVSGIQVYEVFSAPNSSNGLPASFSAQSYFGVFLARTDNNTRSFTLEVQNYNSSMQIFQRDGNDDSSWQQLTPSVVNGTIATYVVSSHKSEFAINHQSLCRVNLGSDTSLCSPISTWLVDKYYHPNKNYVWSTGATADSILVTNPGTYFVTVDSLGCLKSDTVIISEYNSNLLPISANYTICDGEDVTIQIPLVPDQTVNWFDGSNALQRSFSSAGSFWVERQTPCDTAVDTFNITVIDCDTVPPPPQDTVTRIFIPNAFTPNDDGTNDFFFVQGTGINDYRILIFNRWGSLLFESTDINSPWDGTFTGRPVADGVYSYRITFRTYNGKYREYLGMITVLR